LVIVRDVLSFRSLPCGDLVGDDLRCRLVRLVREVVQGGEVETIPLPYRGRMATRIVVR
jgi:hypothetical protein